MNSFPLKIATPDGLLFDGQVEELIVRTTSGDLGILAGHVNIVAPLGMGRATIVQEGRKRYAACIGGLVSVIDGETRLVATTFEWADQIDLARAESAAQRAQDILSAKTASALEHRLAEAKLRRALVRQSVASQK